MENYALSVLWREKESILRDMQFQGVGEGNYDNRPRRLEEIDKAISLIVGKPREE